MKRPWLARAGWMLVSVLTLGSYAACVWLWASPYRRPLPGPSSSAARAHEPAAKRAAHAALAAPPAPPPPRAAAPAEPAAATPAAALVPEPPAVTKARTPPFTSTRNFLIVGLDRRPDGSGPGLADSLLVVVLDEKSDEVGLISIPRDLYVEIPDATTDRINTVYQVARRSGRDPLVLFERVVQDTLKLPIEHVLLLDLGVFERAVDAVGGVDVDVVCPIRDVFLDSRAPGGRRTLDLDPGRRHLDGVTAAMYARSRHGRSDFHRARRQQAVLLGVQRALRGRGALELPALWQALESSVETDLRRIDLLALGRRALRLDPKRLHGLVIGYQQVRGLRTPDGKAVLLPDYDAIDSELQGLFSAPSPGTRPQLSRCEPKDAALGPS